MKMQDLFERALLARGEHLVKTTFKYKVYSRAKGGFYYLGRAGALRVGNTVQGSVPCTEQFKSALLGSLLGLATNK